MNWTQPLCDNCWDLSNPGRPSPRAACGPDETCCTCGAATNSGIFVRLDPRTVAFPSGGAGDE